jgi:hypothetical protein
VNLELPFGFTDSTDLDAYLDRIDRALDECFLSELDEALERAVAARDLPLESTVAS